MSFKALLLVIFIALCGVFIYIKVQSLGPDNSAFNLTTRYTLGKYSIARNIFGLHKDGDARAQYVSGTDPIAVEIVQTVGSNLSEGVVADFVNKIQTVTGKKVNLYNIDTIPATTLTEADLDQVAKANSTHALLGQPYLLIVYAQDFVGSDVEVARTYNEYGMVISSKKLSDLTEGYPVALPQYQVSTMLHEFGHQMGLGHNENQECIMDATVENPTSLSLFSGFYTPANYCAMELSQLATIKKSN